jgi:YidC/Oxa1 family membrane protein insertase
LNVWELIIQQPLTNVLIVISHAFGGSFGVAIVILTILVNLALLPLTLSQIRSSKRMMEMQPKLSELQKKYGKDRQRLAQEQMKLYKESGIKPAGCALSLIIQMPVWFALYQSIMLALAAVPEGLLNLSRFLYPWDVVFSSIPMSPYFLGMDLATPNIVLAIIVGVAMWVQQKMSTMPTDDPRTSSQNSMMLWMMPLLFTFMSLSFPSGLALYWVVNSLFRIVLQYRMTGWGTLFRRATPRDTGATSETKKYLKFDTPEEKRTAVVDKDGQVIITDKESLKKSQKKGFFDRLFGGGNKDQQDQNQ